MATSTDPLRRNQIGVAAGLPQARIEAPRSNSALQLAEALRDITPEAQQAMAQYADKAARAQRTQAEKDAISVSGQDLAKAVRDGKLKATQNPWYLQAYNREAAAITSETALSDLQTQSTTWEEYNDPARFAARWREEVGKVGEQFNGVDQNAGFLAAESRISSQVLQQNTARNSARIQNERLANLGTLASSAIRDVYSQSGGRVTANQVYEALKPVAQQWFGTGGDTLGWQGKGGILDSAITSAAYGLSDASLLDLKKAPEIMFGPSVAGESAIGGGKEYAGPTVSSIQAVNPDTGATTPSGNLKVSAPSSALRPPLTGQYPVSSGFGARKAPTAGASTFHNGIDIAAPAGTPVQAQAVGKVVSAGKQKGFGNAVVVDYGNGVVATYGHLSSVDVKAGDIVDAGQKVGGVGRTGVATGNHLHYRLEVNGKPTDPTTFKGRVGGDFETPQAQQTASGNPFPGQDQPFRVADGGLQPHQFNAGPSLYDAPGVADQTESDRYRIKQAAEAQITARYREIAAQRQARGYEATDLLYQKYGLRLINGQVPRGQIQQDLTNAGYSAPEIAAAMQVVGSDTRDNVAVASAQVAARGQDPGVATTILGLSAQASQSGYSTALQNSLNQGILSGWLDVGSAQGILSTAMSTTTRNEAQSRAEAKSDEADARREQAQSDLNTAAKLNYKATGLAAAVVRQMQQERLSTRVLHNGGSDEVTRLTSIIANAMSAHLALHDGDISGAIAIGDQTAAGLLRTARARASVAPKK